MTTKPKLSLSRSEVGSVSSGQHTSQTVPAAQLSSSTSPLEHAIAGTHEDKSSELSFDYQLRVFPDTARHFGLPVSTAHSARKYQGEVSSVPKDHVALDAEEGNTKSGCDVPGDADPRKSTEVDHNRQLAGDRLRIQLPQIVPDGASLSLTSGEHSATPGFQASEIRKIQQEITRRRRRNLWFLFVRLALFVGVPTAVAGWYYFLVATPMYATNSEFVIQQAESQGGSGLGSLLSGTPMTIQQDSISVQSFLLSREAFHRLDAEEGFTAHFSSSEIDPIRRLGPDVLSEDAYALYKNMVQVAYDPTEGLLKMEVVAADPQVSQRFSEVLIGYAENRVDALTQRVREDAMQGARASYEEAEARRAEALQTWLELQQELEIVDPIGETSVKTNQIAQLEGQRQQLKLELQARLSVQRPNQAQVEALENQISSIEALVAELRRDLTAASADGASLASKNTELRLAEENYGFQTAMVQQALQQMETARIEANRQVRYLETGVAPIAPDKPTYPRAFENTAVVFLLFSGIYLMISITVSILREQASA